MEKALYAEVYAICILVVSLLLYWVTRRNTRSTAERWLIRVLKCFIVNFASNFCFTLFNGRLIGEALFEPASYLFKTLYFISLDVGVFAWCGYAETELKSDVFSRRKNDAFLAAPLIVIIGVAVVNLFTHHLFYIDAQGIYRRGFMFQVEMAYLFLGTLLCSVRLVGRSCYELDPVKQNHMRLTASFSLCILAAWLLSFIGEAVPVICVCVMIELLCLYTGTINQQISMDKLTQVNNRQNLMGFLNYKMKNHDAQLFLLMMDVDYFKSINDTYGHLAGDHALMKVSSILKRACGPFKKRPYIARYGGDEFMIVMEGTEEDTISLKNSIDDLLAACAEEEDMPYQLKLSIGVAEYRPGMKPKDLIAAADEKLYQVKNAR
ncbi:MAG: diguanylate cyclase [Clostridia bacterium]|nr:diguanylate cyclase [Clostridia bacterium]